MKGRAASASYFGVCGLAPPPLLDLRRRSQSQPPDRGVYLFIRIKLIISTVKVSAIE